MSYIYIYIHMHMCIMYVYIYKYMYIYIYIYICSDTISYRIAVGAPVGAQGRVFKTYTYKHNL